MLVPRRLRDSVAMWQSGWRKKFSFVFVLSFIISYVLHFRSCHHLAQKPFIMNPGTPSSNMRPAPPALGDEDRRLASYRQLHRGEGSASRLPTPRPATAATRNARPLGMVASPRVGTPNQRLVSTAATTSSYPRYSASSHENSTPNLNRFTAGAGAGAGTSPNRPTSTASQPVYGDSSYSVWARRQDRLASLQSPVRGHDYAAAGIVRSYHRIPSSSRSEEDATSTQSPISPPTESDNASASTRWGTPAGALRHASHAVAPSIHSQAGSIAAASIATKREDSVAPVSRYNTTTRPRTHSTPVVPSLPTVSEQRPRTYLDMHGQYERTPTYRPQPQQMEFGSNFSPDSPGYTLQQIRQRRSTLSNGFPRPQNATSEQRVFSGPFVDAPTRITASSDVEHTAARKAVKFEREVKAEADEEPKTPGKWRKVSGLFTKKLEKKGKDASPDQISPRASPSTFQSTISPMESPPSPVTRSPMPTPPPAAPYTTRAQEARRPSPLVLPPRRLRPAARIAVTARDVRHSPVSPLSDADAYQGTEGLSPVSPLSEHEHSSPPEQTEQPRPVYSLRPPPPVPESIRAERELANCLRAAAALSPRNRQAAFASRRRRPTEQVEEADEEEPEQARESPISEQLEQVDQELFPSPLVVQKRWVRSHSPLSPTQQRSNANSRLHRQAGAALVGDNAHWARAQEVHVVARGKARLVNSRQNSVQHPPERSRPVLLEAPGPAPEAEAKEDEGDEKERRDTTFAGAGVESKETGQQDKDEDARSTTPSWRTNDSRKFSRGAAVDGPRP
jgi:hypothetical protein